jgi:hypothetical protein
MKYDRDLYEGLTGQMMCTKCGKSFSPTSSHFYVATEDGNQFGPLCKECFNAEFVYAPEQWNTTMEIN